MAFFNELLNIISDFKCEVEGEEVVFSGILQEDDKNIILIAKFTIEQYRNKVSADNFYVMGKVYGKEVTLIGCHIGSAAWFGDNQGMSVHIIPSEIVVGGCFSSTPMVKEMSVSIQELNYMFWGSSPLQPYLDFTNEKPSLLNYTFPKEIAANDKYGQINLFQAFGLQSRIDGYKYNISCVIDYVFSLPTKLMEGLARLSAARSLFSFFGNGYIPFGEITFKIDGEAKDYGLWLNFQEDVPPVNEPFFVTISVFENQFQKIWEAWLDLYEGAHPISILFYEIVCNRSTRVNYFLNLSQAIEIYSKTFRDKQAREIFKKCHNSKDVTLAHRFKDILTKYNDALELNESYIADYAQGFSNMRNYYTHYNAKRYVEPTYDELFSAIHILRYVLLAIVYTAVGIPHDCLLECKKRNFFRNFEHDANVILTYSKKGKKP